MLNEQTSNESKDVKGSLDNQLRANNSPNQSNSANRAKQEFSNKQQSSCRGLYPANHKQSRQINELKKLKANLDI